MEEWRIIPDFPKYSVSNYGNVRQDDFDRIIHPRQNQYGGVYVGLMRQVVQHSRSLPLLVADMFIPRPSGLEKFDTPINLNGDRFNCHVDNLMWRPRWFARMYNHQFKERYPGHIPDPIRCRDTGDRFHNSFDAGCAYGLLEWDVVKSIDLMTYAWPTYQVFELI